MEPSASATPPASPPAFGRNKGISEARERPTTGDAIADTFGPWAAHVYTTDPAADAGIPTLAAVRAEIAAANEERRKPATKTRKDTAPKKRGTNNAEPTA